MSESALSILKRISKPYGANFYIMMKEQSLAKRLNTHENIYKYLVSETMAIGWGEVIMDIDGDNKTLLLNWEVGVRGFSDDGKDIIFEGRPDEKSPWGIYIINIDGTNLRHLTYFDEFLEEWYADIEQY